MRVVIYLRLSNEDKDMQGKNESNSIANQRMLLTDFVKHHPDLCEAELDELCDDGWSGKNFDRPGFTELMDQVKKGTVQCIVVKDFSRFGRDYLTVGNYISRVFPFMGVRFISVNDCFDSTHPGDIDSLDTSFKTLIYDLYSRELSQKVKDAKLQRAKRGLYLSPYAIYGYAKDKENKNHLVVDEPAAAVVRRIFQMALDGYRNAEIAATLNRENVMTPMSYKKSTGVQRKWHSIDKTNFWTANRIGIILHDERYTGTLIYGKRERTNIGHKDTKPVDKANWIICEDQHEAIISKSDFEKVQAILSSHIGHPYVHPTDRLLKRKIYCGVCGHVMRRYSRPHVHYRCGTSLSTDTFPCKGNEIDESMILTVILGLIRSYARLAIRLKAINDVQQEQRNREKKDAGKKLIGLQNEKQRINNQLQELYESLTDGYVSRDVYMSKKKSIVERNKEVAAEIAGLEQLMGQNSSELPKGIVKYIDYADIDELTKDMVDDLVNRVDIYPDNVIKVHLNYADEFEKMKEQFALV